MATEPSAEVQQTISINELGDERSQSEEYVFENGVEDTRENIPKINCPEKIVLCFDLSSELNAGLGTSGKTVFHMVKRSMDFFVKHKLALNGNHKIAILTFGEDALWVQDFSNNMNLICDTMANIHTITTDPLLQFDIMSLFEMIVNHVELPELRDVDIPPEYVVRIIMIYGRSDGDLPSFSGEGKQIFHKYMSNPYFFFDVLYIHKHPDEENQCEEIYETLCKLDETEDCFVLEVPHVATRIFEHSAKLLAHPLQRPKQQDINYKIAKNECSDDEPAPV